VHAAQVAGRKRADKWRDRLLPGVDMGVDLVENALDTAAEIMPADLVHGALSRTPFRRRGCAGCRILDRSMDLVSTVGMARMLVKIRATIVVRVRWVIPHAPGLALLSLPWTRPWLESASGAGMILRGLPVCASGSCPSLCGD